MVHNAEAERLAVDDARASPTIEEIALGFKRSSRRGRHWNYRVIEFVTPEDEPWFSIHEVHYRDGKPYAYTEDPAAVCSETTDGLRWVLARMAEAIDKPALRERDFDGGEAVHGNSSNNNDMNKDPLPPTQGEGT